MTTKRDVPLAGDSLGWVHTELAEVKSRISLAQQAAEQSRALASDAAEKALQVRAQLEQFDGQPAAIQHLQDGLGAMREQLARAQEDILNLVHGFQEFERRTDVDAERVRQDYNNVVHKIGDLQRVMESWMERFTGFEELNRRNLEVTAQLAQRIEVIETAEAEAETMRARTAAALSRIDQDLQRLPPLFVELEREDEVMRERSNSLLETIRRLEAEVEAMRTETNRISRIDDRLELVQAERTRHNERLNELSFEMGKVEDFVNNQAEKTALLEARMSNYQDEIRGLKEKIALDRELITNYLHGLNELASDIRKRQISALEKEIRDIRGRAINFPIE